MGENEKCSKKSFRMDIFNKWEYFLLLDISRTLHRRWECNPDFANL